MKTYEELDQHKRELQRKRQKVLDSGRSTVLLDRLISKTQRDMNALRAPRASQCAEHG